VCWVLRLVGMQDQGRLSQIGIVPNGMGRPKLLSQGTGFVTANRWLDTCGFKHQTA
jgi:hypothetical protein